MCDKSDAAFDSMMLELETMNAAISTSGIKCRYHYHG